MPHSKSTKVIKRVSSKRRMEINLASSVKKTSQQQYREFLAQLYKIRKGKKVKKQALTALVGASLIGILAINFYLTPSSANASKVLGDKEIIHQIESKKESFNNSEKIILPPR